MLPRPYYDRDGVTLFHGDCRQILPLLIAAGGMFDLALSDPPYGVKINTRFRETRGGGRRQIGHGGARGARRKNYPAIIGDDVPFDPTLMLHSARAQILWGANNYASRLPDSPFWLGWDRETEGTTTTNLELAWVGGHRYRSVRIFRHLWCGVRRLTESGGHGGVWCHPMQKPVALMEWCLSFFPKAKTVIDPYMGSGPIAKACKNRRLRYVGIELVEEYCARSVERLIGGPH
jgi:hypothetical protein